MKRIDDIDKIVLAFFVAAIVLCVILLSGCKAVHDVTQSASSESIAREMLHDTVYITVHDTIYLESKTEKENIEQSDFEFVDAGGSVVLDSLGNLLRMEGIKNMRLSKTEKEQAHTIEVQAHTIEAQKSTIDSLRQEIKCYQIASEHKENTEDITPRSGYARFTSCWFWVTAILLLLIVAFWVCDKIPACKPYTAVIKGLFNWL